MSDSCKSGLTMLICLNWDFCFGFHAVIILEFEETKVCCAH